MKKIENESKKERLTRMVKEEILPQLQLLIGTVPEECIELIISRAKLRSVIKDQCFQEEGTYEDGQLHYIYSGICCSYYESSSSDKLDINRIWKKNDVLFDMTSFLNETDRDETFRMLEDGEILSLDYYSLKIIFEQFPEMHSMLLYIGADRERYNNFYTKLLKLPVEDRVRQFIDRNPTLMSRINKDCIALILGISRSSLSAAYAAYKQQKDI